MASPPAVATIQMRVLSVVVLQRCGRDRVCDPLAVSADLRVIDLPHLKVIVNRNGTERSRRRLRACKGWEERR